MAEAGIVVRPALKNAGGRDDWLVMSMPAQAEVGDRHPDPRRQRRRLRTWVGTDGYRT